MVGVGSNRVVKAVLVIATVVVVVGIVIAGRRARDGHRDLKNDAAIAVGLDRPASRSVSSLRESNGLRLICNDVDIVTSTIWYVRFGEQSITTMR